MPGNLVRESCEWGQDAKAVSTDTGMAGTKSGSIKGDILSAHPMLLESRRAAGPPSYQLVSKDRIWWLQTWPYFVISRGG